jgi:periplasmic protein CpxP/Spy
MEIVMSSIDNVPLPPEPPLRQQGPQNRKSGVFSWPGALGLGIVALAFGIAIGADGLAIGAGMDHFGWRQGWRLAMIQEGASRMLDSIGADAAQEAKIHDIINEKFAQIAPDPKERAAMRKQALELLAAPTIDRNAVEKLRADAAANFDAKSKLIASAVLDIADQLTPAQRTALAARLNEMAQHGPMGPWGGWRHHPMTDGGQDEAPDSAPGKD